MASSLTLREGRPGSGEEGRTVQGLKGLRKTAGDFCGHLMGDHFKLHRDLT